MTILAHQCNPRSLPPEETTEPHHIGPLRLSAALALAGLMTILGSAALASEEHHMVVSGDAVQWQPGPPTLPAGAEFAVLHGSPAEEGQFVLRLKFPANYVVPPHRHPKEEHVTVLSGGFGMALGETHDRASAKLMPAGSFMRIPVGAAHFAWTEEETVVQLNGIGPFGVEYVDPKDDPRTN
jgi:quercetin dioxygenase-like cupin family protein